MLLRSLENNQKKNSQPTTFSYIKLLGRPLNSGLPIHFVPGYFPQQLSTKSIILNNKKGKHACLVHLEQAWNDVNVPNFIAREMNTNQQREKANNNNNKSRDY
jgi:hypothetical protein